MFTSTGYQSPATSRVGLIPSVYENIIQLGIEETPILSKIGTSAVKGIEHSWIIDTIGDPTRTPKLEISDFSGDAKSTKQKRTNTVEIFIDDVMISKDMQAIATYGGKELQYEVAKKAKEHKKRFEQMILGVRSGGAGTIKTDVFKAPVLRDEDKEGEAAGIFYYVAKNATSFASGLRGNIKAFDSTSNWGGTESELTWDKFNEVLQLIYDGGAMPKDVFVGSILKGRINAMVTRMLGNESTANKVIKSIDTDFGTVNLNLSTYLSTKYGLGDVMIAGDFEYMKHGLLVPTTLEDVSTSKTATAKRYYTSSTLEVRNANAFAIGVGLN